MSAEERTTESGASADDPRRSAPFDQSQRQSPLDELQDLDARAEHAKMEPQDRVVDAGAPRPPTIFTNVDVYDLDWERIVASLGPSALRARMRATVEQFEDLLDSESGVQMLFDDQRATPTDRALKLTELSDEPLWFIGDIHGDLLALEAALTLITDLRKAGVNPEAEW